MEPFKIDLIISEPFGFPLNRVSVIAQDRREQTLLLILPESVAYKNGNVAQLLATPRNSEDCLDSLTEGQRIVVNMTPILGDDKLPMDACLEFADKWRGWFLIGTVGVDKNHGGGNE